MYVPQYVGLTMEDFLEFIKDKDEVLQYLPDWKDLINLPRAFLINVIHSIVGAAFRDWVDYWVNHRNENMKNKNNQYI